MPRRQWAIIAISLGVAALVIDGNISNVALPSLARELKVEQGAVTSVITFYQLVQAMCLLPFANLADRFGHRRFYVMGLLLFCLASGFCVAASTLPLLLLLRAIQGLGASMTMAVSVALLREIYPSSRLGAGLGFNAAVIASAASLGPALGGFIVVHLPWQFVFASAAPMAIIALTFARNLPASAPRLEKVDLAAAGWSAVTILLLLGGLQFATSKHAIAGLALVMLGAFSACKLVKYEGRRERPVVPVDLLRMPVFRLSALGAVAVYIASGTTLIALPFLLEQRLHFTPEKVGMMLLAFPLTLLLVSPIAGWLSDRISPAILGALGVSAAIMGLFLLASLPGDASVGGVALRIAMCGFGFGMFVSPNTRLLIGSAPRDRSAAAGGALSTVRLLGQTSAATLVGFLLSIGVGVGPTPFYVAAAFSALAAGCCLARPRTSNIRETARSAHDSTN